MSKRHPDTPLAKTIPTSLALSGDTVLSRQGLPVVLTCYKHFPTTLALLEHTVLPWQGSPVLLKCY